MLSFIQDDYGLQRINRREAITSVLNAVGSTVGKSKCVKIDEYFDDEIGLWFAVGVWRDSPESGPRLTWAM